MASTDPHSQNETLSLVDFLAYNRRLAGLANELASRGICLAEHGWMPDGPTHSVPEIAPEIVRVGLRGDGVGGTPANRLALVCLPVVRDLWLEVVPDLHAKRVAYIGAVGHHPDAASPGQIILARVEAPSGHDLFPAGVVLDPVMTIPARGPFELSPVGWGACTSDRPLRIRIERGPAAAFGDLPVLALILGYSFASAEFGVTDGQI